jgi:hypothetical protein
MITDRYGNAFIPGDLELNEGKTVRVNGVDVLNGGGSAPATGEQMVATGVSVNMNDFTTPADLYTVPAGKLFICTKVIFREPSPGIFNGDSTTSMTVTESATNVIMATASILNNAAGNNANGVLIARPSNAGVSIAAGAKLQARCTTNFGSAQTCLADAFGYLIDA